MYNYQSTRPIAAFNMDQIEDLKYANFGRGKDKSKRKHRGLMYAGLGALGLAAGYGAYKYFGKKAAGKVPLNTQKLLMPGRDLPETTLSQTFVAPKSSSKSVGKATKGMRRSNPTKGMRRSNPTGILGYEKPVFRVSDIKSRKRRSFLG